MDQFYYHKEKKYIQINDEEQKQIRKLILTGKAKSMIQAYELMKDNTLIRYL